MQKVKEVLLTKYKNTGSVCHIPRYIRPVLYMIDHAAISNPHTYGLGHLTDPDTGDLLVAQWGFQLSGNGVPITEIAEVLFAPTKGRGFVVLLLASTQGSNTICQHHYYLGRLDAAHLDESFKQRAKRWGINNPGELSAKIMELSELCV